MTTNQWNQVRALFDTILERTTSEQTALLDAQTDDPEVRKKVRELLQLDPVTTDWFGGEIQPAALGAEGGEVKVAELEGQKIGPYRILEPLGRGGMGSVYLAEREDVQKKVALKLVGVSLSASESARRFFLIEQRVLARLEHSNIARFLDAGITKEGTPFFVMEYVEGEAITDFCENNALSIEDRLRLFEDVCEAVGYAHRSLIVHRDLKPSNIFVTKDGKVKLLDFGIAKLLEEEEGDGLVPGERRRLMTPAYAAPEQLAGEAPTTATDVYQLGVVLRELLTGKRTGDESLILDSELEAITSKATEDEPGARYASAETLLDDLRRFQRRQPVSAYSDTLPYQARKFVRRNRWGVMATTVVVVSLIGGLGASLWQARVAGAERDQAQQVTGFLKSLFEATDPDVAQGREITARELLDQGARQMSADASFAGNPTLRVEMQVLLGDLYRQIGKLDAARPLLEAALETAEAGTDPEAQAEALIALGVLESYAERNEQAVDRLERAEHLLDSAGLVPGDTHASLMPGLMQALRDLGRLDEAVRRGEVALAAARATSGLTQRSLFRYLKAAYSALLSAEHEERAEPLLREALALEFDGADEPTTRMMLLSDLAIVLVDKGASEKALPYNQQAVELANAVLDPLHPTRAQLLGNLGANLIMLARFDEAEAAYRETLAIYESIYAESAPMRVAEISNGLGVTLRNAGRYAAAEPYLERSREIAAQLFGTDDPRYSIATANLGDLQRRLGRYREAEGPLTEALEIRRRVLGTDHRLVGTALSRLAALRLDQNRPREALALAGDALTVFERAGYNNPRFLIKTHERQARALARLERTEEAEVVFEEALQIRAQAGGDAGTSGPGILGAYAEFLIERESPEATAAIQRAVEEHRRVLSEDHPATQRMETLLAGR